MARFTLPRDLYFGPDAISELSNLKGHKKAIVVTGGSSMKRGGFLQRVEEVLKETGLEVLLFEGVEPDPSVETVFRGAKAMQEFQPDVIVAIGGGSPIDAAKAMWIFYEHPDMTFDEATVPFGLPKLRRKAIFVAIPSTSGTATEVTSFSVITNYSNHVKYPIADFEITPDMAILDTNIPLTMPKKLTAHTGMDALTHAIEAYVATARSPFSDGLALKAISDVYDSIVASYNEDVEARGKMHIAQCIAGMAFSNALLGIVHSLAHKIGAQYEVPHGCCNAIMLPYVIQYNAKECPERYADIARQMGLQGRTDAQLINSLVDAIRALNVKLNIPNSYKEYGITEDKFKETADFIAEMAVGDPCTGSNPRTIDVPTMKKVLTCCYYGMDVTF